MEQVPGEHAQRHPRDRTLARLPRHLLTGEELTRDELLALIERALELKAEPLASRALAGKHVALIFQKPSTRTRLSFETGVVELGGHPLILRPDEMQLSRGEAPRDTALVLSRHVHAIGIRTGADALVERARRARDRPGREHAHRRPPSVSGARRPDDAARDVRQTRRARRSPTSATATTSLARSRSSAALAGVEVRVAAPAGYQLEPVADALLTDDPHAAVAGAHAVYTDVWVSMGDEATADERRAALASYRIDDALLDRAAPDAIALHDLPAHPGEEITAEVLYGSRQRIWDQAENRRHAQKALLEFLLR